MNLSEKIAVLRKRNTWSQEELADKLEISRQSVSKWESGASLPDLDKIVKLSEIFGVSTDCLLRDELDLGSESLPSGDSGTGAVSDGETAHTVTYDEAASFMELTKKLSGRIAAGVSMCILSPVCIILLGAVADEGLISEAAATGIGMAVLLLLVACAAAVFIFNGIKLDKYEFMEKSKVHIDKTTHEAVKAKKAAYTSSFAAYIASGVALCVIGVIPVIIAGAFELGGLYSAIAVDILLIAVSVGVNLFVRSAMIFGSFDKLLEEGDYTPENKRREKMAEAFSGAYWCAVTAAYLAVSFIFDLWGSSWLIWPIAGVLFAALRFAFDAVGEHRTKK